jgi:hypothetical protein
LFVSLGTNELDRRLVAYADKRHLSLSGVNWREHILNHAALEHPDLKPRKQKGRPKANIGLLSLGHLFHGASGYDKDALNWLEAVDQVKRLSAPRKVSDASAIRQIMAQSEGIQPGSNNFNENFRVRANKVSHARKLRNRPAGLPPLKWSSIRYGF